MPLRTLTDKIILPIAPPVSQVDQEAAFIAMIQAHTGMLRKAASLYTDSAEDREDLLQEIIYQLWKSYGTFAGKSSRSTWLYRVAMNVAIHQLKRKQRRPLTIPLSPATPHPYVVPSTEEPDGQWALFRQHTAQLNLLERGILLLYLEDKSYEEIATIVGISKSNVGTKLSRIRAQLKRNISQS